MCKKFSELKYGSQEGITEHMHINSIYISKSVKYLINITIWVLKE
jgi:hypothetical protein